MKTHTPHPGVQFLLDLFGPSTVSPIFVCSLLNRGLEHTERKNEQGRKLRGADDTDRISNFVRQWDRPGRGSYFMVNAMKANAQRRNKTTVSEIACLHLDVDFKDVDATPDEIRQALKWARYQPTAIVNSGRGLHTYWTFKETIPATKNNRARVEALLKRLAEHFGADKMTVHVACLLRIPFTRNSKNGADLEVTIEHFEPSRRYELDELADWIELLPLEAPALRRLPAPNAETSDANGNAYSAFGTEAIKAPVNVEERLNNMQYEGPGDSGVHNTQLSVTASLLSRGVPVDEVVAQVLTATYRAGGVPVTEWDWDLEEKRIRDMCATWIDSHLPPPATEADIEDDTSPASETEDTTRGAEGRFTPPPPPPPRQPKPQKPARQRENIRLVAGKLAEVVEECSHALLNAGYKVFARGPQLVSPRIEAVPSFDGRTTRTVVLREIGADRLRFMLAAAAPFIKYDGRTKKKWIAADPPRELAVAILAAEEQWIFPPVSAVITSPMLRPDGSVLASPGHDAISQLYLELDPAFTMPPISEVPSRADACAALELLDKLIEEFPFKSNTDRSVALAFMLTLVARTAMPVAPLFLIKATTPGTGKSYFVDMGTAMVTGEDGCPTIAATTNPHEFEKRLDATVLEGSTLIVLDNYSRDVEGDLLAQYVERARVKVRILGVSEIPKLANRATVVVTSNNCVPKGELIRRTLTCAMATNLERPELREFRQDPKEMVLNDRGKYLAACFTIIRAYQAAGCPGADKKLLGSFKQWSRLVRGPLLWLGRADPLVVMETARDEDPVLTDIREFFKAWRTHMSSSEPCDAATVYQFAGEYDATGRRARPEFLELVRRVAPSRRGDGSSRALGAWMRSITGRIVDGWQLIVDVEANAAARLAPRYRLKQVSQ